MPRRARAPIREMSMGLGHTLSGLSSMSELNPTTNDPPLLYKVIAKCKTTKARVGVMTLRHGEVDTPVFMPVGTQVCATMRNLVS